MLQAPLLIAADVGGTFTDVIVLDARDRVRARKVPSTPPDFERGVLEAVGCLLDEAAAPGSVVAEVAHGTTVATNAVLEHRGARTALVTTLGFRDVLELRRIRAPQMYDLFFQKPRPLVERRLRFELGERLSATGEVVAPLREAELERLAERLASEGVESVAVCLLHSYAFPQHERTVGEFLRRRMPQLQVSLSSEILPERREYERTATTVVNAYVRPVMRRYLDSLGAGLRARGIDAPLLMMQSSGGLTPGEDAALRPVYVLESGPAAGVLAAKWIARRSGYRDAITLDIGGTTAKASVIENFEVAYSLEYEVGASLSAGNRLTGGGGELIRAPSIDIAEVGAGGGSIAYLDRAGGLRVGPRSAGAVPGPACYRRGGAAATLTDANVVLGYIRPGRLANGDIEVDVLAAQRAIGDQIAAPLGMDPLEAAWGVHRIANARTIRALRAVSTERGRDPRRFVLVAFGGSGPIHAAGLADELHVSATVVPPLPGLLSALGLLCSGVEHHDVRSCLLSGERVTPAALRALEGELRARMLDRFTKEGFEPAVVRLSASVDLRFKGQTSEIRIPLDQLDAGGVAALRQRFEAEHERLYGHRSDPDNPVEAVALRLVGRAPLRSDAGSPQPVAALGASGASRRAYFGARWGAIDTPVVARRDLRGNVPGPLLVDEYDSTTVVPPGVWVRVDEHHNLVLERRDD